MAIAPCHRAWVYFFRSYSRWNYCLVSLGVVGGSSRQSNSPVPRTFGGSLSQRVYRESHGYKYMSGSIL